MSNCENETGCCRSIKHYFLLDQGDFIVQFMDMADEEMRKSMDEVVTTIYHPKHLITLHADVTS